LSILESVEVNEITGVQAQTTLPASKTCLSTIPSKGALMIQDSSQFCARFSFILTSAFLLETSLILDCTSDILALSSANLEVFSCFTRDIFLRTSSSHILDNERESSLMEILVSSPDIFLELSDFVISLPVLARFISSEAISRASSSCFILSE
jgi:hypothetical protein